MFLFPFIVTTNGLVDPDASPLQFVNIYPLAGLAVSVAELPELYVPPPVTLPPPEGLELTDTVYVRMKFAVILLFPYIVTVRGLDEPVASPLQPVNA